MVVHTFEADVTWAMVTEDAAVLATACGMVPVAALRWQSGIHELQLEPERRSMRLIRRGAVVSYAIRWWIADDGRVYAFVIGRPPAPIIADLARADELTGGRLLDAQVRGGSVRRGVRSLRRRLGLGGGW